MRLINADWLHDALVDNHSGSGVLTLDNALEMIDEADTIDPVHAAGGCYCHECKYYSEATLKCFKPVDDEHTFHDTAAPIWKPTDFCSYGKRDITNEKF